MLRARVKLLAALMLSACAAWHSPARADNTEGTAVDIPECASDPKRLGLSRVVEIDTTNGPHFGGGHGAETDFLKDREVVLTFDDGPMRAYTKPILKALAEHCTRATFFVVGRMAAADPALLREVSAQGHTVATHTLTHMNLQATGLLKGRQEVDGGIAAITRALGKPPAPFFRFPFLGGSRHVDSYTRTKNVATFWVDVDSKDYQTRDPKIVHSRIMSQLRAEGKGIILMHDIQPSSARAIGGLLNELRDKGFKVVHIVPKPTGGDAIASVRSTPDEKTTKQDENSAGAETQRALEPTTKVTSAASAAKLLATARKDRPEGVATPPTSTGLDKGEVLPWLAPKNTTGSTSAVTPPAPTPATRPKRQARSSDDNGGSWFPKIFNY